SAMPCSLTISTTPTGTTLSTTTPRRRSGSASVSCGSWRRAASRWWPLTCRSRPSAGWRSPATCFVLYRPSGSTDRLFGLCPARTDAVTVRTVVTASGTGYTSEGDVTADGGKLIEGFLRTEAYRVGESGISQPAQLTVTEHQ